MNCASGIQNGKMSEASVEPELRNCLRLFAVVVIVYMGGCQNYGPFLGTLNIRCRIIIRTQKGSPIWTTTHIYIYTYLCIRFAVLLMPASSKSFSAICGRMLYSDVEVGDFVCDWAGSCWIGRNRSLAGSCS